MFEGGRQRATTWKKSVLKKKSSIKQHISYISLVEVQEQVSSVSVRKEKSATESSKQLDCLSLICDRRTEKDRKKERNKLRKKGGWVARCQLLKQWNGMSSGGRKKRSSFNHWELVRQTVKS